MRPPLRRPQAAARALHAELMGALGGLALALVCLPALALDSAATPTDGKARVRLFASPAAALRKGMESLRAGNVKSSVEALTYAAENGYSLAEWKLGKMYADGDGVKHDDEKAYRYFSKIIEDYDEDTADGQEASVVANAYVTVGIYTLKGIPNTAIRPDPERALELFQFSAINFGDPNAQYNLARMYLDGTVVDHDERQAARWLNLAADKNHRQAQALLGHMLFTGHGIPRQRARGLMYLTLARGAARGPADGWIVDLYSKDQAIASEDDRQAALVFLDSQTHRRN